MYIVHIYYLHYEGYITALYIALYTHIWYDKHIYTKYIFLYMIKGNIYFYVY